METTSQDLQDLANLQQIHKGKGTAAVIWGILSLCFCCGPFSLVFGIIAILTALRAKKLSRNTVGNAGLVLGIIGTIGSGIVCLIMLSTAGNQTDMLANTENTKVCLNAQTVLEYCIEDASVIGDPASVTLLETYADGNYYELSVLIDSDTQLAELFKKTYDIASYDELHNQLGTPEVEPLEFAISSQNVSVRIPGTDIIAE